MTKIQSLQPNQYPIKVLAFTASMGRPILLRNCCLQMYNQSYPVTHAVYNNAPEDNQYYNYLNLISDIKEEPHRELVATFGVSKHQHINHINAISLININEYDLFLKIDDDDYYHLDYVKHTVEDFVTHQWDFSGCYSYGLIEDSNYDHKRKIGTLGLSKQDEELGVEMFMPPTMAFSRKAIKEIINLDLYHPNHADLWEDQIWRRVIWKNTDLKKRIRPSGHFIYNRHSNSVSRSKEKIIIEYKLDKGSLP